MCHLLEKVTTSVSSGKRLALFYSMDQTSKISHWLYSLKVTFVAMTFSSDVILHILDCASVIISNSHNSSSKIKENNHCSSV